MKESAISMPTKASISHPHSQPSTLHPCPFTHIQILLLTMSLPSLLCLPLLHRLTRDPKPFNARWHATIARSLQDDLSDFFLRAAIVQRSLDMSRKLGPSVLAAQHSNVEERPSLELKPWASPD